MATPSISPPRSPPPAARPASPTAAKTTSTPAAAKPVVSRLGAVKRGLLDEPKRFYFYGPEGVGKSSLAADAGAIFFDIEGGSGHLDLFRYPFRDGNDGHIAETMHEVYAAIDDLLVSPHDHKALAIDTLDALESLIWKHVCEGKVAKSGDKIVSIEDFGYGKGYQVAAEEWRRLIVRLDRLRLKRQMHILFLGHEEVKEFRNPVGENYDRIQPELNKHAIGVVRKWVDVTGRVTFDDVAAKVGGAARARGVSTGSRIIQLEHNAAWNAKCRLPLPSQIELALESPWAPFAAAIEELRNSTPDSLRTRIASELDRVGEAFVRSDGKEVTAEAVRAAVTEAGDDVATLTKYLTVLNQSNPKESQ